MIRLILAVALCLMSQATVAEVTTKGDGALLRTLDRVTGKTQDILLENGEEQQLFERLSVHLHECRYPMGNPLSDSYAYLSVHDKQSHEATFSGWMIASSPALHAMDHPRYDIWLLRCMDIPEN